MTKGLVILHNLIIINPDFIVCIFIYNSLSRLLRWILDNLQSFRNIKIVTRAYYSYIQKI